MSITRLRLLIGQNLKAPTGGFLPPESSNKPVFDPKLTETDWREFSLAAIEEFERRRRSEPFQAHATIDLSHVTHPIAIMPFSDVHLGSQQCDYATLLRHAEYLKRYPHLYGIILGDLLEWAISQRQMDAVQSQLYGVAFQGRVGRSFVDDLLEKILAAVLGNHEGRSEKFGGFDVGEYLYDRLIASGVPYLKDGGSIRIRVGTQTYTGLLMHGDGIPGNSMYSKTAKHQRTQRHQWGWHDFAMMGHTHESEVTVSEAPSADGGPRREVHMLQAGSYKVVGEEQFPHRMGYRGSPEVHMPVVVLWPDQHLVVSFRTVEAGLAALGAWN
jgi:predicted phosphodiesterase